MARSPTPPGLGLDELVEVLERAELRGHGGAFFPTATKLRAVGAQRKRPIVVVNGSEGEPLSRKDRFLLSARTDVVLDGAFAAAGALGADTVVVAVDHQRQKTIERVRAVLALREEVAGRGAVAAEVVPVPTGFVTGQETALLSYLDGGAAKPTAVPPYVFERGLRKRPTLVSNVETFAQIGRVVAGTYDGTRYVTVSGAVPKPAVIAITPHTSVNAVLTAAGGVTDRVSGVLLGGYGGTWVAASEALELNLDERALRARGLTLGAGIVHVLGASRCAVGEIARITRWMAGQSAGQCGPCVFGLDAIAGALEALCADGVAGAQSPAQLERWCAMVEKRGGCAHPDGVARFVRSGLRAFAAEFSDHALHGPCDRCPGAAESGRSGEPALAA